MDTLVLTFDDGSFVVICEVHEVVYECDRIVIAHGCNLDTTSYPICRIEKFSVI